MTTKWNPPGSRWWKFDFHTHTPASNDYAKNHQSITPEVWLQHAMQSGLDCVVVTDHNSGDWIDQLKTKNQEMQAAPNKPDGYRELTIFPGVEITVNCGTNRVHLLAVFDPSCGSGKVTAVLGACGITADFGDDENTSTQTSFLDTVQTITEKKGIAIPAHIDGKKGLLYNANLNPELKKSLGCVNIAEFIDPHAFNEADPQLKKQVDQLTKVQGSDAHQPTDIGQRFSWLKMSQPSIEGLRLALLDHEFCVNNQAENPNHLPDVFLSKLTIQAMSHCGRIPDKPFVISLHPHLNAIIGGRGTGKSTIIESIRIASRRDQNMKSEAPGVKKVLDRFMQLSQNKGVMLNNAEILLELHRRGKNYQLRWRFDGQGTVLKEQVNGAWQKVETKDPTKTFATRFAISIFSQKQINELASDSRGLLAIIDRAPEVNKAEWDVRWKTAESQFLQWRERQRELWRQLANEQQFRVKLEDIENDLKQYEEKGHGEVLKQYQKRSQQKNALPDDQIFDSLSSNIRALAGNAEMSDFPTHLFDEQDKTTAEIREIHEQSAQALKKIGESLARIAEDVDGLKTQRAASIDASQWCQTLQASVAAYHALAKEYQEKQSQFSIALYGEWVQQRNQCQQQLKRLASVRKETEATEKQITQSLAKLEQLRAELFEKRRKFLDKVIGNNDFVRMQLVQYGDVNTLEGDYRALLNIEGDKFASSVYDEDNDNSMLWKLIHWEGNIAESDLPQHIAKVKKSTLAIARGQQDSGNHGKFDKRLKRLLQEQPTVFDQLDAWWPEDRLRVEYKDPSSGQFNDLEKGSAGQKAAAILAFLLSHGNEPLIIDQPEDDLDNALIYDLIVKQIHRNKHKRQLIIATHNPNIVVNGDSELVHVLKFAGGQVQIDQQGGLEEHTIRSAICTILEGGRAAFKKRYQRIALNE